MRSSGPGNVRSWEILVSTQEELAWFRDNLARALSLLGYEALQSHLFAAEIAHDGYLSLESTSDASVYFSVRLECEGSYRRVRVDPACQTSLAIAAPRECRWLVRSPMSLELAQDSERIGKFTELCERVGAQLDRKCRTQMNRAILEQNQELRRQLEAVNVAERAAEAKGAFLASMSHELRTPMNSILGFTRRLRRRLDGKIEQKDLQALEVISRNGNHLLSMINDILDFSKVEAEQEDVQYKSVAPCEVVQAVLLQCDPLLAEGQELRFQNKLRRGLEISADENKIRRILINLVSNAIKYGGQGPIDVCLEHQEHDQLGSVVVILVNDQGPGMSEAEQTQIFSPFARLDNEATRTASGTGLGLAIAARYAKMHSGLLEVRSELGRGSTFSLILPEVQPSVERIEEKFRAA